jgi:hypothetical protein
MPPEEFTVENIQFLETKPNIIMHGVFTKIIFSDSHFTLNGIYILFPVHILSLQKNFASFDPNQAENRASIETIVNIERKIVDYFRMVYYREEAVHIISLRKQLQQGIIKISHLSPNYGNVPFSTTGRVILKISGVWENQSTIGLTYKFIQATS